MSSKRPLVVRRPRDHANARVRIAVFARLTLVACCVLVASQSGRAAMDCAAPTAYTSTATAGEDRIYRSHAIAMHGEPKYPPDFDHFEYANPNAPKGGRLTQAISGTFDSFNGYIDKGSAATTGAVETLTVKSHDEAFTQYGLIAEQIEWPDDRSWVTFYLRKEARWHDGEPITADDVIWTFNTLLEKGRPFFKFYYGSVASVDKVDTHTVKFSFSDNTNRELPLIVGELPVLPKHYWADKDFSSATLEPPLGSGPYRVKTFEAGRYITLERVEDYWGKDLAINRGMHNFDEEHFKYYRDDTAIRLALKAGEVDLRAENQAKAWASDYDIAAVDKGWLIQESFATSSPEGMQAFIFNLRRPLFQDRRVRRALDLAFDFEWSNKNLFYGQYTRNYSYWSNSELAATDAPDGEELAILEHYRACLPESVFTTPYTAPTTDGNGWPRENLVAAANLLEDAGYVVEDFVLVNEETGEPFVFEMLYSSPTVERILLPYVRNLKRLGIDARARLVDTSQYVNRLRSFDFDMIWTGWGQTSSPGNEQRDYWSTAAADNPSSRNLAGIKNPVIDQLIELVIEAPSRESLVARTRALDRTLLAYQFVVPNWHLPATRLLFWDKFGMPEKLGDDGPVIAAWWLDPDKAARLASARENNTSLITSGGQDGGNIVHTTDAGTPGWFAIVATLVGLALVVWILFRFAMRGNLTDAANRKGL